MCCPQLNILRYISAMNLTGFLMRCMRHMVALYTIWLPVSISLSVYGIIHGSGPSGHQPALFPWLESYPGADGGIKGHIRHTLQLYTDTYTQTQ